MAKAWKDVIASPQYQSLQPDQQAQAQEQYFNEVVAPRAGDQAAQAREQFYSAYPTPVAGISQQRQEPGALDRVRETMDLVNEVPRVAAQGAVNLVNAAGAGVQDAVNSAVAWGKGLLGGNDTYIPAERMQVPGDLQPKTTAGKVAAEALPYFIAPESAAPLAATRAGRVAEGAAQLLAQNAVGTLAANSDKNDAGKTAADLATGAALGGVVKGVGDAVGAVYRGVKGSIAPEAQQAIKFAENAGVPLHTTDLIKPQGKVGNLAQGAAESIPFVGTSGMRATQQEARSKLVDDFTGRYGVYDPAEVISSLRSKTGTIRAAAGNRLESIKNQMQGVAINPTRTVDQIDTELGRLKQMGRVADNETIGKLQAYRDELTRTGAQGPIRPLDMEQLSNLRTQFRQDVKGDRQVMPSRSDAAINRVYNAMTGDLNGAIGSNLGGDAARKYQQANAIYANEASKLNNTRLKNVLMKGDLTPEVVNNMLFSAKPSEVRALYSSVGNAGRAQMRNGIIGKALEKSTGSPDSFLTQLNKLSGQTGIAFKGADAAYVKGLKNYLEATDRAGKAGVTTPTGQQLLPWVVGSTALSHPGATAATVSYGTLSRMYESKPIRNAMLKLANTPRGSSAFERNVQEVMRHINSVSQGARSEMGE